MPTTEIWWIYFDETAFRSLVEKRLPVKKGGQVRVKWNCGYEDVKNYSGHKNVWDKDTDHPTYVDIQDGSGVAQIMPVQKGMVNGTEVAIIDCDYVIETPDIDGAKNVGVKIIHEPDGRTRCVIFGDDQHVAPYREDLQKLFHDLWVE